MDYWHVLTDCYSSVCIFFKSFLSLPVLSCSADMYPMWQEGVLYNHPALINRIIDKPDKI